MNIKEFYKKSKSLRVSTFLKSIEMGEAHLGGSFSMIELLLFIYVFFMNHKKDSFILSKSHASIPYLFLLKDRGYKPKFKTHLELDSKNGIHCTTGSLGHGLPIGVGIAISRKIQKKRGLVFILISDGECQEGTTWESFLIASKFNLSNLVVLIDYNKIQALTHLKKGLDLHNLEKKIRSFNFNSININNGHSFSEMKKKIKSSKFTKPTAIIFNTIKGYGVKEFEDDPSWHAKKIKNENIIIGKKRLGII